MILNFCPNSSVICGSWISLKDAPMIRRDTQVWRQSCSMTWTPAEKTLSTCRYLRVVPKNGSECSIWNYIRDKLLAWSKSLREVGWESMVFFGWCVGVIGSRSRRRKIVLDGSACCGVLQRYWQREVKKGVKDKQGGWKEGKKHKTQITTLEKINWLSSNVIKD